MIRVKGIILHRSVPMMAALLALVISAAQGFAQTQDPEGTDFDQTQIITGDRTLTVDKAFKIATLPNEVDIDSRKEELSIELIPRRPAVGVEAEPIDAARVKMREPLQPLYNGYVKGGVGTYQSPLLEAMYHSTRKRDLSFGVKYRHLSSNRGIRNVAYSGFSQNELAAWGKKIFKQHSLETKASFERDVWHYYGWDPQDLDVNKKDIQQRFDLLNLENRWRSYYRDSSKVNHDLVLNIYQLNDRLSSGEFGLFAGGELHAYRGAHYFSLNTGFDLISYSSDGLSGLPVAPINPSPLEAPTPSTTNAIVHATPRIVLQSGGLRAAVGMGLYMQVENIARFHAFPDAELSYSLFNNLFIPYAGVTGSVNRVGYRSITGENPFVLNALDLQNSITRYRAFGGIRGSISDKLSFNTAISIDRTDQTPLFVNDITYSRENRFDLVYDDIRTLSIMGEVNYMHSEKWEAGMRLELLSYSTDQQDEAWHLPAHRFSLFGKYRLYDKLHAGLEIFWIGKRDVRGFEEIMLESGESAIAFTSLELPAYLDMSLELEYRYTKRLSAFVQVHNLSASRYDIYYRFPAQRGFAIGGMRYAF